MKTFMYNGLRFKPIRLFADHETFFYVTRRCRSIGINRKNRWNWEQFYEKANQAKCGKIDVFLLNGRQVVPCGCELFEYDNDYGLESI